MKKATAFAIAIVLMAIPAVIANAASTEECKKCHEDEYKAWNLSAHYDNDGIIFGKPGPEACIFCHFGSTPRLYSVMYGEVSAESPVCEMCHKPPVNGFTTHITTPSEAVPPQNLSAEVCEDCHTKPHHIIYEEWNEYNNSDYDSSSMESHSEPSENGTYMQNNGSESRVTCVMCHEPHSAQLRMDAQELCESCHSSEILQEAEENNSDFYGGPQWEMYNGSIYTNGVHAVNLKCIDCHMATIIDENGEQKLVTGHSFNFDPVLLSDPDSGNICKKCHVTGHEEIPESGDCNECHEVSLANITSSRQEITASKLQELEILQENASTILLTSESNESLEKLTADYNEAISYIEFVKTDGSLGMHNSERTEEELAKAEIIFRSIEGEENTYIEVEDAEIAGKEEEEENENTVASTGIADLFLIISITAIVMAMSKKKRGK